MGNRLVHKEILQGQSPPDVPQKNNPTKEKRTTTMHTECNNINVFFIF